MALVHAVEQVLLMAGLGTTVSASTTGVIWDKRLVNAATGTLNAITRLSGALAN